MSYLSMKQYRQFTYKNLWNYLDQNTFNNQKEKKHKNTITIFETNFLLFFTSKKDDIFTKIMVVWPNNIFDLKKYFYNLYIIVKIFLAGTMNRNRHIKIYLYWIHWSIE